MVCTIGLVLGFKSSSKLAAAYGVAVTSTMLITTTLFFVIARHRWQWHWTAAVSLTGLFFLVDIPFFLANISKILHGAWFPLVVGAFFFFLMMTWKKGRKILAEQLNDRALALDDFRQRIEEEQPHRVRGQAVYLATNPNRIPRPLCKTSTTTKSCTPTS